MNCQEIQHWLDAYCDGELDLPRNLEIEQHLRDCPACARARDNLKLVGKTIRAAAFTAPKDLEQRLRAALQPEVDDELPKSEPGPAWPWFTWGLSMAAASLVLGFILAQTVFHPNPNARALDEITDNHIRSLVGDHLVDVVSSDQHTVRPWFEGKVDFAPAVPDLSAHGFEIIGGRLSYIAGHPAVTLVYQVRKHYVSLFLWPSGEKGRAPGSINFEREPAQRGYEILRWNSAGMTHWAISEINADELRDFAKAFAAEEAGH